MDTFLVYFDIFSSYIKLQITYGRFVLRNVMKMKLWALTQLHHITLLRMHVAIYRIVPPVRI